MNYWTATGLLVQAPGPREYEISWFRRLDSGDHGPQWITAKPLLPGILTIESVSREFGRFQLPNPDDVGDGIGVWTSGATFSYGWKYRVIVNNRGAGTNIFVLQGGGTVWP